MSNIPTVSWDEASPAGSQDISLGDDRIRELKTQLREVIAIDHEMESSGQDTDWGYHNKVTLLEESADPTAVANTVILYTKETASKAELYCIDEDSNVIQLTSGSYLYTTNGLIIPATKKIHWDGSSSGDTYDYESSANVKDTYVGGVNYIKIDHGNTKVSIPAGVFETAGAASMLSTLTVAGATSLSSTLGVTGLATLTTLSVTGAASMASTLGVTGAATLASTLNVSGITTTAGLTSSSDIKLATTKKLYLDTGGDTYFIESAANDVSLYVGGNQIFRALSGSLTVVSSVFLTKTLVPSTPETYNLGSNSSAWNTVYAKDFQDVGCLAYFDDGVEMPDGSKLNDIEALTRIEKDTKMSIHGTPMLKYKSFPKVCYKPSDSQEGKDAISLTALLSIMIGAFKEIDNRIKQIEAKA